MTQVGKTAVDQSADVVQRHRGVFVASQQKPRVGRAGFGGEGGAIDQIAAVARQRDAVAGFGGCGTRFGILTGESAHANHSLIASEDEDQAHLEQDFQFTGNGVRPAVVKTLATVAALQ